jgi:hypothetical protein
LYLKRQHLFALFNTWYAKNMQADRRGRYWQQVITLRASVVADKIKAVDDGTSEQSDTALSCCAAYRYSPRMCVLMQ